MTHKGTQTIETSRLILRRAVPEDAQPMFRNWASDPEVTKYLTWPTHTSMDVSRWVCKDWVSHYDEPNYYQWAIELKEIAQPIGSIAGVKVDDETEMVEIGYCIGKKWWHQGIVAEALGAVMKYLFEEVGYHRIEAMHDPNNPNSGRVMRKCGMKYEGTTHASDQNNQGICDADHYAILREDWRKPKHFMEGYTADSDTALVQEIYRRKSENDRLNKSQAARVEFLTTVR